MDRSCNFDGKFIGTKFVHIFWVMSEFNVNAEGQNGLLLQF
jgi:hypothetical protein